MVDRGKKGLALSETKTLKKGAREMKPPQSFQPQLVCKKSNGLSEMNGFGS